MTVSFLALCFNHAPWLGACLDSIAAQDFPDAELIVLDNASDDGSPTLISRWVAERWPTATVLLERERRGICANVNRMLARASGRYFALVSTDDLWAPEKTRQQVAALDRLGEDWAVAYGDARCIDAHGAELPGRFIARHREFAQLPEGDVLRELLRGPFIPAMSTLVRRSALDAVGPYDEQLVYEDYDAWLRLAEKWSFHASPEPLCAYRILDTSMIRTVAAEDRPEKVASDLRIMTRAARMPRLDDRTRANLQRRTVTLACRLLAMSAEAGPTVLEAAEAMNSVPLRLLARHFAAAAPVPERILHKSLAEWARTGKMSASERALLPKAALAEMTAPRPWWQRWFRPRS